MTNIPPEMKKRYEEAKKLIENSSDIKIYSHTDCDGISSGAILSGILKKIGKKDFEIEIVNLDVLENVPIEHELTIFSDLGSGQPVDKNANEFTQAYLCQTKSDKDNAILDSLLYSVYFAKIVMVEKNIIGVDIVSVNRIDTSRMGDIGKGIADGLENAGKTVKFDADGTEIELSKEDLLISPISKEGFTSEGDGTYTVVLSTEITKELADLGLYREFVSKVQQTRKDSGLKMPLRARIRKKQYQIRRKRVEKKIQSGAHTIEETILYAKEKYDLLPVDPTQLKYQNEKKSVKEAVIYKHKPELLGEFLHIAAPDISDEKSMQEFYQLLEERERIIETISDEEISMDFKMYELVQGNGHLEMILDSKWNILNLNFANIF